MLHLLLSINSMLLIQSSSTLLRNLFDFGLAEVSFSIPNKHAEGDKGEKHECDDHLDLCALV